MKWCNYRVPTNLCAYVRTLIFRLLILVGTAVLSSGILYIVGVAFIATIGPFFDFSIGTGTIWHDMPLWVKIGAIPIGLVGIIAIFTVCVGAIVGIGEGISKAYKLARNRNAAKDPSIFTTYIRDKHSKICRHLEFKD